MGAERAEQIEKRIAGLHESVAELQKGIYAIEQDFVQLEKEVGQKAEEWPHANDIVYYIDAVGNIRDGRNIIPGEWDRYKVIGNLFRTKSEAKFASERLKVLAEMRRMASGVDEDGDGFFLAYSFGDDAIVTCISSRKYSHRYGVPLFRTEHDSKRCADTIGKERLKKYYFMVEGENV